MRYQATLIMGDLRQPPRAPLAGAQRRRRRGLRRWTRCLTRYRWVLVKARVQEAFRAELSLSKRRYLGNGSGLVAASGCVSELRYGTTTDR